MSAYSIVDSQGSRQRTAGDFPLALGGPQADITVDPAGDSEPLAYFGLDDGDLFVQAAEGSAGVRYNGVALAGSQWLKDGDRLQLGPSQLTVEIDGGATRFAVREATTAAPAPPKLTPPRREPAAAATIQPIAFEPKRRLAGDASRTRFRPVALLVVLVLAAMLGVAGFLLTARSIAVEVTPPPDLLAFESRWVMPLGDRFLLRPGSYRLMAEKDGFTPLSTTVEVTRDSQQSFRFELAKLPGRLVVGSGVDGVEVLVDGESRGFTPLPALELAPGVYDLAARAERYQELTTRVEIAGAGSEQSWDLELVPRWAEVTFDSQPGGARVRVDGETLGETPLTAEILDGSHRYDLVLAGHKPHGGRFEVTAGEPLELPSVRLRPSDGNLVLSSDPAGATVGVNGSYRGETPLDLFLEPGREHEVTVSKAGFDTRKQAVSVRSGQSQELNVVLTPQQGEVRISSWPPDAELFVDGEARGSASQQLELPAIPHQIEIRKAGFVTHSQTLTPLPGVPQWVEVTLKPVGQERAEAEAKAAPPKITTSQGHVLLKIAPGKLQMGASRREPGRRSNEVLRQVELTRPFYLATQEVSNRQYRKFKEEHFSGQVGGQNLEIDHHPAVRMTWQEAAAYCNWLSRQDNLPPAYVDRGGELVAAVPMTTGYRLPTEAEWAWVARYPDGGSQALKYPWGESLPVPSGAGNYADASAQSILPAIIAGYNDQHPITAPVESFQPNARGFYHLNGNVAEWMHDYYAIRLGGSSEVERDPRGPETGELHVIRGASWMHSTVTELRLSFRDYGSEPRPDVGFRIARYAQ
ncbi:MAG: PEGA domain-containing protein [Acidobacteriota bacterium]